MRTILSMAWFALGCIEASGQIFLISGTPTPMGGDGYAALLVSVAADGSTKTVQEIAPGDSTHGVRRIPDGGTEWITIDYDDRKAVVVSRPPDNRVIVVDLDTASITKSCVDPDGTLLVGQWLLESPSRGPTFAGYSTAIDERANRLLGMSLTGSDSCSFTELATGDLAYVFAEGFAGIASLGSYDFMDVHLDSAGGLAKKWLSGDTTCFSYKVPAELFRSMKNPSAAIVINNRQIFGLRLIDSGKQTLLVLRKNDNSWSTNPDWIPGRAFGSFIASSESHPRRNAGPDSKGPESAGRAEWRPGEAKTGPSILGTLVSNPESYPGILHLYDAATEKSYTIKTDQGDSEILLADNGKVYYRVSDRLYSAAIEPATTTIGMPQLVATNELIRDAHRAFMKH